MKIGILMIATGQYNQFVSNLVATVNQSFLRAHERHYFLFTDHKMQPNIITAIPQQHMPWPHPTLRRYEIFWKNRDHMRGMDYLYYLDVDMVILNPVGHEVIGEIVAVLHPGFWTRGRGSFPYETRRESTAYIPPHVGQRYYAGGFQGGARDTFLGISHQLSIRIETDLKHGVIAAHNDESHWNWYLASDQKPTVELDPSYCYPQGKWQWPLPAERRIIALSKNHAMLRST